MYLSKKWAYRLNRSPERESLTLLYTLLGKLLAKIEICRVTAVVSVGIAIATSGWLASPASLASDLREAEESSPTVRAMFPRSDLRAIA
jgi:hypothetical protein